MTGAGRPPAAKRSMTAQDAALRMLARRALSEGEIRERLAAREYPPREIEAVLARLRELGLVDDRALCAQLARAYRDVRRYGRLKVVRALRARRFAAALVAEAVAEAGSPGAEGEAAAAALRKRFGGKIPAGREGAAKAYRFLAGRGFLPETCREAIRKGRFDIPDGED